MKAVLLAAGEGKRLRPATLSRPKPFLPIAGTTLFHHNLHCLKRAGVNDFLVIINYMKEKVVKILEKDGLLWIDQGEPKGTGHAVMATKGAISGKFFVAYSDVYLPCDVFERASRSTSDFVVVAAEVEKPWEFGVIMLEEGKFRGIVEKPRKGEEPSNLVIAGLFMFNDSIYDYLDRISVSPRGEYELTDAITQASKDVEIEVIVSHKWMDAGRPPDFLRVQRFMMNGVQVHETSEVRDSKLIPPVIIGPHVRVKSSIVGPYVYLEGNNEVFDSELSDAVVMIGSSLSSSTIKWAIISENNRIDSSKLLPGPEGFSAVTAPNISLEGCTISSARIWSEKDCSP